MYKLLVIITWIVILTLNWNDFTEVINLSKILEVSHNIMEGVKND